MFLKTAALLCVLSFIPAAIRAQSAPPVEDLIFVSDTQSPLPFEKLYPNYRDNERATQVILSDILKEKDVDAVIHAGDITGYGSSKREWRPVLPFLDSLRTRGIPFIAAKGNHDYYFLASEAMRHFETYVPESPSDFSLHQFGRVAVILLNSNFSKMKKGRIANQSSWYSSTLTACDSNQSIAYVITVDHHPPYTNSAVVPGSKEVRKDFLPAFFRSPKSVLFVSGHAHRFEHFRKSGKDFVVIGGGGGVFQDERKRPVETDLYTGADKGMFFHYVRCEVYPDSLVFHVIRVLPESNLTEEAYDFSVRRPVTSR